MQRKSEFEAHQLPYELHNYYNKCSAYVGRTGPSRGLKSAISVIVIGKQSWRWTGVVYQLYIRLMESATEVLSYIDQIFKPNGANALERWMVEVTKFYSRH
jgi:hypothetical protein